MASTWKILAALALFLILPAGAYVTGAWVGPPPASQEHGAQLVDQDGRVPTPPSKEGGRPSGTPPELVAATDEDPATAVRQQPSASATERGEPEKQRRVERKPATTDSPSTEVENEPSGQPGPTDSAGPSEALETQAPAPTESPAPSDAPETAPAEPTPSAAPSDEAEGVVGS